MRSALRLATVAAAIVLMGTTGCSVMRGQQSAGNYASDAKLTARVKTALLNDPEVAGTHVNVDVYRGKVTLTGVVDNESEKSRATKIARQTPGVKSVDDALRVASAGSSDNGG